MLPLTEPRAGTRSYNPATRHRDAGGLGCSPVARHYWGNHSCFLLLRVLRCFSSPGSPHIINHVITVIIRLGCPIRKSAGNRLFAPDRGLSQLITSFIASVSQGIRHAPLITFSPLAATTERDKITHGAARSYFQLLSLCAAHVINRPARLRA